MNALNHIVVNGVEVYKKGESPKFSEEVPTFSDTMISKYGWKIVDFHKRKCWEAMDELEYREMVGKLLKIDPSEVDITRLGCRNAGGSCFGDCNLGDPHDPGEFCTTTRIGDSVSCICTGLLPEPDRIKLSKLK